jgi:hemerythrin-like domain-containing protein
LYPEIDRIAGTPWATRMMRYEHQQIRQGASRLRTDQRLLQHEPDHHQVLELRCQLFGLEAIIRAHLEREESVLFPLLDGER